MLLELVPADPDRRGGCGVSGQQDRRGDLVDGAVDQAEVGLAVGLEAAGDPGGQEA